MNDKINRPFKNVKNLPDELKDNPGELENILHQIYGNFIVNGKDPDIVNKSKNIQRVHVAKGITTISHIKISKNIHEKSLERKIEPEIIQP